MGRRGKISCGKERVGAEVKEASNVDLLRTTLSYHQTILQFGPWIHESELILSVHLVIAMLYASFPRIVNPLPSLLYPLIPHYLANPLGDYNTTQYHHHRHSAPSTFREIPASPVLSTSGCNGRQAHLVVLPLAADVRGFVGNVSTNSALHVCWRYVYSAMGMYYRNNGMALGRCALGGVRVD